mgnify:CR=1 FL=1
MFIHAKSAFGIKCMHIWGVCMKYKKELELLVKSVPEIYHKAVSNETKITFKQRNEVVTSTDLYIEEELIKIIHRQFPDDRIHSEEFNRNTELGDRTWLIDPIDGTSNYVHKLNLFVIQVALYDKGEVVLSYIHVPTISKTFYATKGEGSFLNGKQISVYSLGKQPNRLMSMVGLSHQTEKDKSIFMHLIAFSYKNDIKIRILGSLGYEMAAMAEGSFVMLYTDVTNYWDIAPGLLLVKEAGGLVVNKKGEPYVLDDSHLFMFCDKEIMQEVLNSIANLDKS